MATKLAFQDVAETNEKVLENIKECAFFKNFPSDEMGELASVTEMVTLKEEVTIVSQGEHTPAIYFLMKGRVGIHINGERVSKLQRKGDLIGELNLISNRPSTSTLITETECEFLKFDVEAIKSMPGTGTEYFEQNLYKFYAVMLTEKLEATTDSAKQFELVIRQLKETQAALQMSNENLEEKIAERTSQLENKTSALEASHAKLEDLYNTRDMTFEKLGHLQQKVLRPLAKTLGKVFQKSTGALRSTVKNAEIQVEEAIEILSPLASIYKTEQAMKSKRILLAETSKKRQLIAKMALGGTGVTIDLCNDTSDGQKLIENNQYDILLVDGDFLELSQTALEKNPELKVVLMSSDNDADYFKKVKDFPFVSNFITRNFDDRSFTVKNILTTVTKIVNTDIFGLEKYLSWGADVQHFKINHSGQRKEIIQGMDEYFSGMGIRSRVRENFKIVAEEMLMNMIYDAPRDEHGKSLYNHLDRTTAVELKKDEEGFFRYGCDGVIAAVSAIDPFGGLEKETVIKYFNSCEDGNYGSINKAEGKGGAGLGLFQILTIADLVVFNVRKGFKTEVIALFNLDPKNSDNSDSSSLHFFMEG